MPDERSAEELIRAFALKNAVQHGGSAKVPPVLGAVLGARPDLRPQAAEIAKLAARIVREVNGLTLEEQRRQLDAISPPPALERKEREGVLPELPNAEPGKVVMRLAPYPSGQLHLGRARMAILNDEYVKRYRGRLILVIDDTAGSAEKMPVPEAYDGIPRDLRWLGVEFHDVVYKSDRLEIFYEYAKRFLEEGWAYVCTCDVSTLRRNRAEGRECKCRSRTVEENLELWQRMIDGGFAEGEAVVRLKTDMRDPDTAFRDRVLLRISERTHPRVGNKYRVWPMLEFSWAIDDHLLGITHILRGKDLMMEDRMERFMWDLLGWPHPVIVHHGLLQIAGVKISSSACRRKIESGEYEGWDDPRTWTIGSLRVRGFKPEAIRSFILSCGLTLTDVTVPIESLYAENRKMVDSIANRYNFVEHPVRISVEDAPRVDEVSVWFHPDFHDRGTRTIKVNTEVIYVSRDDFEKFRGKVVRLKDLFNIRLGETSTYAGADLVQSMPKIHWVSEPSLKTQVMMPDGRLVSGLSDPGVGELSVGSLVQFVRFGFCRLDSWRDGTAFFRYAHP